MKNKSITFFLIDDDEDDREFFELALQEADNQIQYACASNGLQALKLLSEQRVVPDYIFLDLNMPQMNGRECLTEIKKNEAFQHIPVIIFTTSSAKHDLEETMALGALDFITKPAKISELTLLLKQFITTELRKI